MKLTGELTPVSLYVIGSLVCTKGIKKANLSLNHSSSSKLLNVSELYPYAK